MLIKVGFPHPPFGLTYGLAGRLNWLKEFVDKQNITVSLLHVSIYPVVVVGSIITTTLS
jgi:hypothetical protein